MRVMRRRLATPTFLAVVTAAVLLAAPARAQDASTDTLQVGDEAPDFSLPGATRDGLMERPIQLSDFRGQTVVLAFFFQARTRG